MYCKAVLGGKMINKIEDFKDNEKILRKEFFKYMKENYKKYSDSTIKTFFSDAKFSINNELGISFFMLLLNENLIESEYRNILIEYFSKKKIQKTPESHATAYERAIKYLREFMIEKNYLIDEKEYIRETNNIIEKFTDITEKNIIIKTRVGQGLFKKKLLAIGCKCNICGISIKELLIASHCKPWSKANDKERLDVNNGLLLCPTHDAIFDKGLITFDNEGRIIISTVIPKEEYKLININENVCIDLNNENIKYMTWYRENIFKR